MDDGAIDFSRYSLKQLREAMESIDAARYPENYQRLSSALRARLESADIVEERPAPDWSQLTTSRTISSIVTFPAKFVYPIIWIIGAGRFLLPMWLAPGTVQWEDGSSPMPPEVRLGITVGFVIGLIFFVAFGVSMQRIRITADGLTASNYLRQVTLPFSAIQDVNEERFGNVRWIELGVAAETPFGRTLRFIPRACWSSAEAPIVAELRSILRHARSSAHCRGTTGPIGGA